MGLVTRNVSKAFSFLSISSGKGSGLQGCALKSCAAILPGEGRIIFILFSVAPSKCLAFNHFSQNQRKNASCTLLNPFYQTSGCLPNVIAMLALGSVEDSVPLPRLALVSPPPTTRLLPSSPQLHHNRP